jgi:hypothetical protein
MPNSLLQAARRDPGTWLIIAAACVAFFGVAWLGFYYDDFSNIAIYRSRPFIETARDLGYNRFPLFALGLYPLMLLLPAGVAHLLVAAAHTTAAVLLRSVLKGFGYSERVAVSAGLLFLLAPAHTEVLHWVVASTVIFGVCFLLASTLMLMRGRVLLAGALAVAGMLFSEAIILPVAVVHGLVLLLRRTRLPHLMGHMVGLATPYAVFLVIRYLCSAPGRLTQYETGLANARGNTLDILMMSVGLMTSRDLNWFWNHSPALADVGLRLPLVLLLPALAVMSGVVYALARLPGEAPGSRSVLLGLGGTLAGFIAALGVFLIVTGNTMQPRYTYAPLVFLTTLVALLLGTLDRGRAPRAVWMTMLVGMLGWSLYRVWSHVWSNWYPARLVTERVLRDVETTARETGAKEVYVVNAPRSVGNAYVFMREWAYLAAGQHLLSTPVLLTDYPPAYINGKVEAGSRFTNAPCAFLGWRDGQRVIGTRVYDPSRNLVLDCASGVVEAPVEGSLPELRYVEVAEVAYRDMMGSPATQLTTQSAP